MPKDDPLVSVVTPVYNGEKYLRECIESVLSQTYTHWDYTIVDNCSSDATLDIARQYAAKDPRIRVHNNDKFVRVIANYNIAFRQISPASKYCKVVAADDWLFPECLEKMVGVAEGYPSVAIVGSYNLLGTTLMYGDVVPYHMTVMPGREACRARLLGRHYVFAAASLGLFRADLVRRRPSFYNESNLHADLEACFDLLAHHDFGFVHQVLTFRREHEDSLTSVLSEKLNTYQPNRLAELVKYGPRYLSEGEWKDRLRDTLEIYYRYLAQQVYEGRGREFWSFHRRQLAEAGRPLKRRRLAARVALYTLDLVLNPKTTAERAGRRLRRVLRDGRTAQST
jgi:glycosyltransferase involved in cell wall biosynthesis